MGRRRTIDPPQRRENLAPVQQRRFEAAVVGVSFQDAYPGNIGALYEDVCRAEIMGYEPGTPLWRSRFAVELRRNPANEHDPNAIEVYHPTIGMLGHLPRALAARLAPALDAGVRFEAWVDHASVHADHVTQPGAVRLILERQ